MLALTFRKIKELMSHASIVNNDALHTCNLSRTARGDHCLVRVSTAEAESGETFNIVSTSDINGDGATISDRPIGIKRNSGKTPPQFNVDLRYSRFFNFTERYKLEVFGEFQNLFNINSIVQFTNVTVTTNTSTGELIGGLADFKARNQSTSQDSRQFQLGFKFIF